MERGDRGRIVWIVWGALTMVSGLYLAAGLRTPNAATDPWLAPARRFLLPGATSDGHHQIEISCEACHGGPFGGPDALQDACVRCHGAELKAAEDKHPLAKFADPRNAALLAELDATRCITCHVEHRPEVTGAMGVTLPIDYCFHCHQEIGEERPSHADLGFDTCAAVGCHNFHDNRALYEDFLLRHLDDAETLPSGALPARDFLEIAAMLPDYPSSAHPRRPLDAADAEPPADLAARSELIEDWAGSSHARAGVGCRACHEVAEAGREPVWTDRPDERGCRPCHGLEIDGFFAGKHGMRAPHALGPMTPAAARLPMREAAGSRPLGCASCHGAHRFDTRPASVDACLECHADEHSRAYRGTPHHRLWLREIEGAAPPGSGVSCASCHLPRIEHRDAELDVRRTLVQHNQNDTLRPSEKMLRPVCLSCHGLGFSIDALADPRLVEANFSGRPGVHVRGLEMAGERSTARTGGKERTAKR